MRRSWVEIDLEIIVNNYNVYSKLMKQKNQIMCVVKANAYGHGDVKVSSALNENGIHSFAVSNVLEAVRLRENGIVGTILILGYTPLEQFYLLKEFNITQTIISLEYAQEIMKIDHSGINFYIAIDTGMRRIGLNADNLFECESNIRYLYKNLQIVGIFTHLCVADNNTKEDVLFTRNQIRKFDEIVEKIEDLKIKSIHCMNSCGAIKYSSKFNNIVRLGVLLYGLRPNIKFDTPKGIKPALTWKSVISMVKELPENITIGYGRTYKTDKKTLVATIPVGYADGYSRNLSNKGKVLFRGKQVNVIGSICMDQMMIDLTGFDNVALGEEVVLMGTMENETIYASDIAKLLNTIDYEIVCSISERVEKVYI